MAKKTVVLEHRRKHRIAPPLTADPKNATLRAWATGVHDEILGEPVSDTDWPSLQDAPCFKIDALLK